MQSDIERLRRELEIARETADLLWKEYGVFAKSLDPTRSVATPEELRRLGEAA